MTLTTEVKTHIATTYDDKDYYLTTRQYEAVIQQSGQGLKGFNLNGEYIAFSTIKSIRLTPVNKNIFHAEENHRVPEKGLTILKKYLQKYNITKPSGLLSKKPEFKNRCVYCDAPHQVSEKPVLDERGLYRFECTSCKKENKICLTQGAV